jgi:NADH pyrophosphatase NudC (nudix superfamily)
MPNASNAIRHWVNRTTKTCPHCGTSYRLGRTGVEGGCDNCLGIQRDRNGYAWLPDETEQTYMDVDTGTVYTVTRAEAFE